jgi:hypothetical protein
MVAGQKTLPIILRLHELPDIRITHCHGPTVSNDHLIQQLQRSNLGTSFSIESDVRSSKENEGPLTVIGIIIFRWATSPKFK